MAALTPAALRQRIASGDLAPVYLLVGDDEHEKGVLAGAFADTIDEGLRAFNLDRFDGADVGLEDALATARIVPVMAPRRIVIALRAERMLQPTRESEASRRALDALEDYLETPCPETTLVLVASGLDERRRIARQLRARAAVVRCGAPEDPVSARRWIQERLREAGREADAAAVRLLSDVAGRGVASLRNAVERLLLYVDAGATITTAHVSEVVGSSATRPTDDWAVARAIEQGTTDRALRELGLALDAGAVPHMVLGQLAWVARTKLAAARVEPAIAAVFRTDLALKQSGGEPRVLLERLVVDLCGTAATGKRRRA
ncbi:MAG: DNA polymerase III subunit delta [Acidobacteria bacterium]|nr:DNA polymerase III subunit delta [Acidobacteriota bacterium]